jgi:hypothetical protein
MGILYTKGVHMFILQCGVLYVDTVGCKGVYRRVYTMGVYKLKG